MFGKYGIDFDPETHEGFSDHEWKLACEFFDLMLHLPLPEDEDEWDSFFDWALSEVFDVDENTDQEAAFAEAEDALEWLRGLFEKEPEQNEVPFDPYFKIKRTSETPKRSSVYRDGNGNLHCWNISAYQIPSISLTEEISGTVYTVTGSFEGFQNMLRKLIQGIYVEAPDKSTVKRRQTIHIKYDGIGFIPLDVLMNGKTA